MARSHDALGSLREALACLEVAEALAYTHAVDDDLRARVDHVLGPSCGSSATTRRTPGAARTRSATLPGRPRHLPDGAASFPDGATRFVGRK